MPTPSNFLEPHPLDRSVMARSAVAQTPAKKRRGDQKDETEPSKRRRLSQDDSDVHSMSSPGSASSYASEPEEYSQPPSRRQTPMTPRSTQSKSPSARKIYDCPYDSCDKSFNRPARLEEHIRSHTNTRSFACTYAPCTKTFLRQSHLAHHIKTAHTSIRDYACSRPGCDKRFTTGTRLRRHEAAHDGRDKFRCTRFPPCDMTFRKHATLQQHVDVVHLQRKPHRCTHIDAQTGQTCTHGYDTASKLRVHVARVHEAVPQYWCAECPVLLPGQGPQPGFATYAAFQDHMRTAHPPTCTQCRRTFATPRALTTHVATAHSDAPPRFPCPRPACGKAFASQSNLATHVAAVHERARPFVCGATDLSASKDPLLAAWDGAGACGGKFSSKAGLQGHVRSQHLRGKPGGAKRRQPKSIKREAPPAELSAVARLTGVGYAEESGRAIPCPRAPGCAHRFVRYYDVEVHALAKHGMDSEEVAEWVIEQEALGGGVFWVGGGGEEEEEEEELGDEDEHEHEHGTDANRFAEEAADNGFEQATMDDAAFADFDDTGYDNAGFTDRGCANKSFDDEYNEDEEMGMADGEDDGDADSLDPLLRYLRPMQQEQGYVF